MNRRNLARAATLGVLALATATATQAAALPGVVVQTRLRSHEGEQARLIAFLEQNWLAMDRIAIHQGLFTHATLYRVEDDPDADLVVEVGYVDPGGYAAIASAFERIRAAHRTVLIEGRDLPALGRIVGERRFTPLAAS